MAEDTRISEQMIKTIIRDVNLLDKVFKSLINEACIDIIKRLKDIGFEQDEFTIVNNKNLLKVLFFTSKAYDATKEISELKKELTKKYRWLFFDFKIDLGAILKQGW